MGDSSNFTRFMKMTAPNRYSLTVSDRTSLDGLDCNYEDTKITRGVPIKGSMAVLLANASQIVNCNLFLGYNLISQDRHHIFIDDYTDQLLQLSAECLIDKNFFRRAPIRFSMNGNSLIENLIQGHKILENRGVPFPFEPENITFNNGNYGKPQLNIYTYDHQGNHGDIFNNLKQLIRWICDNRDEGNDDVGNTCFNSLNDLLNQRVDLIIGHVPTEDDWRVIMNHPTMWSTGWIESFLNQTRARISANLNDQNMCLGHVLNNGNYANWRSDILHSGILEDLYNSSVNIGVSYGPDCWSLFRFIQNCFAHKRGSYLYESDLIEAQLQALFPSFIVNLYEGMLMLPDFQFRPPVF